MFFKNIVNHFCFFENLTLIVKTLAAVAKHVLNGIKQTLYRFTRIEET